MRMGSDSLGKPPRTRGGGIPRRTRSILLLTSACVLLLWLVHSGGGARAVEPVATTATTATTSAPTLTPRSEDDASKKDQYAAAAPRTSRCTPDKLDLSPSKPANRASGERFLVYSPQFGLSNQVVALRNAVVWAILLNRTLVLPHLLGHGTAETMAAHGDAFDVAYATSAVAPTLRVEPMETFLLRGLAPSRLLVLDINIKMRKTGDDSYFEALGTKWLKELPEPLHVPMRDFMPTTILDTFGGCDRAGHRVLAFRSLFAALDVKRPEDYPADTYKWLNTKAMPALLKPNPALTAIVDRVHACLVAGCGNALPGASSSSSSLRGRSLLPPPPMACVHIRQGDFEEECAKYDTELASKKPRPWVLSHAKRGYSCLQSEGTLVANLRTLRQKMPGGATTPIFASIEDGSYLSRGALQPFNLSSLSAHAALVRAAREELGVKLPDGVANVLLDQLVCARASHLVLNAFSTFSQLVMGRIGMEKPAIVGWARDLNEAQQRRLGVTVDFWRTDYWRRKRYV